MPSEGHAALVILTGAELCNHQKAPGALRGPAPREAVDYSHRLPLRASRSPNPSPPLRGTQ